MATIDSYFNEMKERGASDLHMVVGFPPLLRLRDELVPMDHPVLTPESNFKIIFEILSPEQQASVKNNCDFNMAYELENVGRFRCNILFQHRGMGGVFRIIPIEIPTLEQLGLPEVLKTIASCKNGLILVTGPTGSGKSTTLAAMINHINENRRGHIIVIEDPIEFVHSNKKCIFSQREIGTHSKSFSDALMTAGLADPDVILVGDMRDPETISSALTCAELDMLVFGTFYTNSATKTIDRIINAFPEDQRDKTRAILSESLRAVIAQQLLTTKDGEGKCAANEILIGTTALGNLIIDGKLSQINSMILAGKASGMQGMDHHLMQLVGEDRITREEAYEKAIDKNLFK